MPATRHSANSLQEKCEDITRVIRSRRKTDNKIAKPKKTKDQNKDVQK